MKADKDTLAALRCVTGGGEAIVWHLHEEPKITRLDDKTNVSPKVSSFLNTRGIGIHALPLSLGRWRVSMSFSGRTITRTSWPISRPPAARTIGLPMPSQNTRT